MLLVHLVIICFIFSVFLLMIELTVSIVRGKSSPQRLSAEDLEPKKQLVLKEEPAPQNLLVSPKHEFEGWNQNYDGDTGIGIQYEVVENKKSG